MKDYARVFAYIRPIEIVIGLCVLWFPFYMLYISINIDYDIDAIDAPHVPGVLLFNLVFPSIFAQAQTTSEAIPTEDSVGFPVVTGSNPRYGYGGY